jgi:hypothetical protein
MKPTIQQLNKDVRDYLIETMKDQYGQLTLMKDQSQHYYNVKGTCEHSNNNYILSIRTEVFMDKEIDSSHISISVFIECEDNNARFDFSIQTMKHAVTILSGFINMSMFFHR